MKAAFNQNNIGLYPLENEFVNDCIGCLFLHATTSNSYTCQLINFGTEFHEKLPQCFNSIFISEPLSDVFKL